jgi:PIN domain nuclease of toxin-antitoxin system
MRLVLDTCALVALAEGEPMRAGATRALRAAQAEGAIFVPAVVALEIAQKAATGRLTFAAGRSPRAWFEAAMRTARFRHLPVTADMALAAYELPEPFHRDPADRLIVAAARILGGAVVTVDAHILAYGRQSHVQVLGY